MNIFGINGAELMVLLVLALLLLGPEKIPEYTRMLADGVKKLRRMGESAKEQFKEETGTDFDDVDWAKYDPRQYDPRRVIREAMTEPLEDFKDVVDQDSTTATPAAEVASEEQSTPGDEVVPEQPEKIEPVKLPTPFDSEAT